VLGSVLGVVALGSKGIRKVKGGLVENPVNLTWKIGIIIF